MGLKSQIGDFNIKNNIISKWTKNDEIFYYSGLQIVSRNIFDNNLTVFTMNEIWSNLIKYNNLKGEIINSNIFHIGDKKSFENF